MQRAIHAEYTGHEAVSCQGQSFTGPGAEGELARWLIGEGADPHDLLCFMRLDRAQVVAKVDTWAVRGWRSSTDPTPAKWRPHPEGSYHPRIMRWYEARKAAAAAKVG